MPIQAKVYDQLLGLAGFSDRLLNNHFGLYQGYVANVNKLTGLLEKMLGEDKTATPEYAELKRRFGWEMNGVRLHELYFENLTRESKTLDQASTLYAKIIGSFRTLENWQKDFLATGAMRGIGWVILYYDPATDRMHNVWINEHDTGHLAGAKPILVMDVFEHAFMIDHDLKKADYLDSFIKAVDWQTASARLE